MNTFDLDQMEARISRHAARLRRWESVGYTAVLTVVAAGMGFTALAGALLGVPA